jgi:GABA permease
MRQLRGTGVLVAFGVGGGLVYLAIALLLVVGLDRDFPLAGWIGFGLVVVIVLGLSAGMAVFLVRSSRDAGSEPPPRRPAPRAGERRVLVVADASCAGEALCRPLAATLPAGAEVLVVAPALVSALHYLDSDVDGGRRAAAARVEETLAALEAAGIRAEGRVGSESPLEAIADTLAAYPASEIVVATPPPEQTNWLEQGVVDRARALYDIPVSHLVVETPAASGRS